MASLTRSVTSVMMLMFASCVSLATINCNHAVVDGGEAYIVADVCYIDGADSQMLQCLNGQGILMTFEGNAECDADQSINVFEQALAGTGFADEVICDADPCHIAVFEVYDGHDSDDNHGSEDSTDSTSSTSTSTSSTSTTLSTSALSSSTTSSTSTSLSSTSSTTPSSTTSTTTSSTFDFVNGTESESSESHSAESGECDQSGSPNQIAAFIIDECQPIDSATVIISCTGTHDATVEYYPNDDCSGSSNVTTTVEEFFGEFCATMVACNVEAAEAGEPVEDVQSFVPTPAPTSAPTDAAHAVAIFAPLLIAFAALLNA